MQEAVTFNGFLHESGKQISIQIPASAYIQLGERRVITAKEALAVGMDLTHLADEETGKQLFSEGDLLAIRLANSQIKTEGEFVQITELQSIAEEIRAKAVGMQPAVSFMEKCRIPIKEGKKMPALIEDKASMSKEQLAPAKIYKGTPMQNDEFLTNDEDDKALIAEIENYLRLNFGFRIYDAQIYLFNANIGFYTRVSDNEIDYLVNAIFGERIKTVGKSYIYREVREFLRRESNLLVKDSQLLAPRIWVFRDKFVDSFSGEMRLNDGNVFVCSALQCEYDEYAICPNFEVYLDSIAGGDGKLVQLLWEVIAYLLSRETRAKKIVFLPPLALVGRRRQHMQRTDSQLGGQPPAHAVRGAVQIGVAGVERDVPAHGPRHAPLHVIGFVESFERVEDDRMMRHDEVAALLLGFGEHLLGHVHGQQGTADLPFGIAHYQTGIVVFLLQRKRRETLDRVGYLLDLHGQKSDCS